MTAPRPRAGWLVLLAPLFASGCLDIMLGTAACGHFAGDAFTTAGIGFVIAIAVLAAIGEYNRHRKR